MPQGPDTSPMDIGEQVTAAIDFAKWLNPGVTIVSITSFIATNQSPSGGSAYVTASGAAQIGTAQPGVGGSGVASAAVLQLIVGVAVGIARLTATIVTSDGQTLIGWVHQEVRQPA
jgi:hypothetical protein